MLLFSTLTILGCGKDVDQWTAPVVVDFSAAVGCPELSPKARAEFRRTVPRPKPDTTGDDGKPAVSKRGAQEWIDALEVSERRKNAAGAAIIAEHDRCRGATASDAPLAGIDPKPTS